MQRRAQLLLFGLALGGEGAAGEADDGSGHATTLHASARGLLGANGGVYAHQRAETDWVDTFPVMAGRLYLGTSGFAYPEWKGDFYPTDIKADAMLAFYAGRFSSVEINYTFQNTPSAVRPVPFSRAGRSAGAWWWLEFVVIVVDPTIRARALAGSRRTSCVVPSWPSMC